MFVCDDELYTAMINPCITTDAVVVSELRALTRLLMTWTPEPLTDEEVAYYAKDAAGEKGGVAG